MAELLYLAAWEDKLRVRERQEDFKSLVFASDLRPDEYSLVNFKQMFKDEFETDEESLEWEIPKDQMELEEVLAAIAGRAQIPEAVEEHRV